jgi:hypothetical protein
VQPQSEDRSANCGTVVRNAKPGLDTYDALGREMRLEVLGHEAFIEDPDPHGVRGAK